MATFKGFVTGVAFTLVILSAFWIKNHYRALVMAVSNPEAVESIQVEKNFKVTKLAGKK